MFKTWTFDDLTGGGAALDGRVSASLSDGHSATGHDSDGVYRTYTYNAASTAVSSVPDVIVPADSGGTGRWELKLFGQSNVDNIASLRAITYTPADGQAISSLGYYAAGDGGGGPARYWKLGVYGPSDDNGGSVIVVTGETTGAWVWDYSGSVSVKWYGAYGDNTHIDTLALQACDDNESNYYYPEGVYITDYITLNSDRTIEFKSGAEIRCVTAAQTGTDPGVLIFWINEVINVSIAGNNTLLWMNKSDYVGEQNPCIRVYNSQNIYISGIRTSGAGSDGMAIGGPDTAISCDNVWVKDCTFDDSRRNGASIQNATNSGFIRCIFSNTVGYAPGPGFGLDLEPNIASANVVDNITIRDCVFVGNNTYGLGIVNQSKNVIVENCVSYNNGLHGFGVGATGGNVKLINCNAYTNGADGFLTTGVDINLINCKAKDNTSMGFNNGSTVDLVIDTCKSETNTLGGYTLAGALNENATIKNSTSDGDVDGINIAGYTNKSHSILNNTIADATSDGMWVQNCEGILIRGNTITGSAVYAIFNNLSPEIIIENNIIKNNFQGILVSTGSDGALIKGNICYDNGNDVTATHNADITVANLINSKIRSNTIVLTEVAITNKLGVLISGGGSTCFLEGNDWFEAGDVSGISVAGTLVNGGNRNFDGTWSTTAN